jgi:glycerol transport system ATP-binding protein
MNFLPLRSGPTGVSVGGHVVMPPNAVLAGCDGALELGVRPEYVTLGAEGSPGGLPGAVIRAQDIGTYWLITARVDGGDASPLIRVRSSPDQPIPQPGERVWVNVLGPHTCFYANAELVPGVLA